MLRIQKPSKKQEGKSPSLKLVPVGLGAAAAIWNIFCLLHSFPRESSRRPNSPTRSYSILYTVLYCISTVHICSYRRHRRGGGDESLPLYNTSSTLDHSTSHRADTHRYTLTIAYHTYLPWQCFCRSAR